MYSEGKHVNTPRCANSVASDHSFIFIRYNTGKALNVSHLIPYYTRARAGIFSNRYFTPGGLSMSPPLLYRYNLGIIFRYTWLFSSGLCYTYASPPPTTAVVSRCSSLFPDRRLLPLRTYRLYVVKYYFRLIYLYFIKDMPCR